MERVPVWRAFAFVAVGLVAALASTSGASAPESGTGGGVLAGANDSCPAGKNGSVLTPVGDTCVDLTPPSPELQSIGELKERASVLHAAAKAGDAAAAKELEAVMTELAAATGEKGLAP